MRILSQVGLAAAAVIGLSSAIFPGRLSAADRAELIEDAADARIRAVEMELSVTGKLHPEPAPEKALKLAVEARFQYSERRRPAEGREAQALRSVRHYLEARASIQAGQQLSNVELRNPLRLIVTRGEADGVELFSPSGPLTYGELELLHVPGDSLALLALLPEGAVEPGESWSVRSWSLPLLTGMEAVEKGTVTCKLVTLKSQSARIDFSGEVNGATLGAAAAVRVDGHLVYDREQKLVTQMELTQSEQRSIGAVSPGLDVVAKAKLTRGLFERPVRLTDTDLADVPLEPNAASRLLLFDPPGWNLRLYHDRRWHVFQQTSEAALLRLLDKGGLIAQCNIKKLPDAGPGKHTSEEQFREDIAQTLGKSFEQFVQSETLKLKEGLYVHRVVAVGAVERRNSKDEIESSPLQWIYYLVANPEGRQASFVFTLDPQQVEKLESADLAMVTGIEFLLPRAKPTPTANRRPGK
jgi:hypothetical protein